MHILIFDLKSKFFTKWLWTHDQLYDIHILCLLLLYIDSLLFKFKSISSMQGVNAKSIFLFFATSYTVIYRFYKAKTIFLSFSFWIRINNIYLAIQH